ncbi:putative Ig domain protein [compost metagenome]
MNTATGAITGTTAATAASRSYTVTVTDGASPAHTATANFNLEVTGALTASVAVANRTAAVNDVLNYTPVTGAGGNGALSYTVSPALPTGLSMSPTTGAITGTAAATAASRSYTVTVTDGATPAHTATAIFTMAVDAALSATTAIANRTAAVGDAVSYTPVTGAGGTGTLTYSVLPALPGGLNMNTATGAITGTAAAVAASRSYTVTVTDGASPAHTATANFTLTVNAAPAPQPPVPALQVTGGSDRYVVLNNGDDVDVRPVEVAGGAASYTYSVWPALPTGLSIDATGRLTGRAKSLGDDTTRTYTATVRDRDGRSGSATFYIQILP